MEHAADEAFRLEHDAEILRVAILAQPKRELFGVEMVVEIRKNGRI